MRRRQSRCCLWWCSIIVALTIISTLALIVWGTKSYTIPNEKHLLSRITAYTPISGFYGPGTYWAWLITLGMSHGHTGLALLRTGKLPAGWDYDLIGATCYIVAAAIDLMHKSRTIAQLGDKASESVLLPALVCAERVVSVGTGSSLVSMAVALLSIYSSGMRRAGILLGTAIIPLIFALVASRMTFHAHGVISQTTPVLWCSLHDDPLYYNIAAQRAPIPFILVDFVASEMSRNPFLSAGYWPVAAYWMGGIIITSLLSSWDSRNLADTLWNIRFFGVLQTFCTAVVITNMFQMAWVFYWIVLWWPVYILAFFPQMGFFPLTGTSVLEMDQVAALVAVVIVAAIRLSGPIFKMAQASRSSSTEQ
ncbi:hypothetical protein C8F04DRAFT_483763 [Mycena alexandri]|uniref:Uncharacterized protein n=1 Tax=Mycena alexandri TaxID=1745969 RepID=A0AAD6SZ26_9AGAR|nr:hypothetical protein C8F04DRAFT_483763 [Mycena alexandri]